MGVSGALFWVGGGWLRKYFRWVGGVGGGCGVGVGALFDNARYLYVH